MPVALFSGFLPESCAFLAKGGSGQGSSLDPQSCTLGHPQGQPPSDPAFSFSPSHRGWTSGPDVSGASVGVGCGQSQGEEEGAHQLEEPVLAGERV